MEHHRQHVEAPAHAVPRRYLEPILYLAERMSQVDRVQPAAGKRMAEEIAERAGHPDVRLQRWYRTLDDKSACERLDLDTPRKAALITMALVLKADTNRGEAAREYFHKIREMLGAEPVVVPTDLEEHRKLTERYLVG